MFRGSGVGSIDFRFDQVCGRGVSLYRFFLKKKPEVEGGELDRRAYWRDVEFPSFFVCEAQFQIYRSSCHKDPYRAHKPALLTRCRGLIIASQNTESRSAVFYGDMPFSTPVYRTEKCPYGSSDELVYLFIIKSMI